LRTGFCCYLFFPMDPTAGAFLHRWRDGCEEGEKLMYLRIFRESNGGRGFTGNFFAHNPPFGGR